MINIVKKNSYESQDRNGDGQMLGILYGFPEDIPVHFFGETQLPMMEFMKRKKRYQFICFMIFHMLIRSEKETGKFTITEMCEYNRMRIKLSNNGRRVFEAIEDCFSEWVIKMPGSAEDILDFSAEYMLNMLHNSDLKCTKKAIDKKQ